MTATLNCKEMVLLKYWGKEGLGRSPKKIVEGHALYFGYECDQLSLAPQHRNIAE